MTLKCYYLLIKSPHSALLLGKDRAHGILKILEIGKAGTAVVREIDYR